MLCQTHNFYFKPKGLDIRYFKSQCIDAKIFRNQIFKVDVFITAPFTLLLFDSHNLILVMHLYCYACNVSTAQIFLLFSQQLLPSWSDYSRLTVVPSISILVTISPLTFIVSLVNLCLVVYRGEIEEKWLSHVQPPSSLLCPDNLQHHFPTICADSQHGANHWLFSICSTFCSWQSSPHLTHSGTQLKIRLTGIVCNSAGHDWLGVYAC